MASLITRLAKRAVRDGSPPALRPSRQPRDMTAMQGFAETPIEASAHQGGTPDRTGEPGMPAVGRAPPTTRDREARADSSQVLPGHPRDLTERPPLATVSAGDFSEDPDGDDSTESAALFDDNNQDVSTPRRKKIGWLLMGDQPSTSQSGPGDVPTPTSAPTDLRLAYPNAPQSPGGQEQVEISVSIGRVEFNQRNPEAEAKPKKMKGQPPMTLTEYLAQRRSGHE